MSDLLKNTDLKDMSVDAFLEMSPEEVAEFTGFKKSPMGVYTGTTEVEAEMNDDGDKLFLKINIKDVQVVELIKGVDDEAPEEIPESDIPTELTYSYTLPDRGQNFKADFGAIADEMNGGPCPNFRTAMEKIDGIAISFTNELSHSKAKKDSANGSVKKGDRVTYQNIKNISLLEV